MILKPEDAAFLIAQTRSDSTVLIGGQAISFWTRYFGIEPRIAALTEDIDYLGTKAEARRVSARLKLRHKLKLATLDDHTPNTALLSVEMEGYDQPVLIDYLASIMGAESKDVQESAVVVEFEGEPLRVLHPVQLLQTKIWNPYRLENKRTPEGIEQARLAIEVVCAFIGQAEMDQKDLLDVMEGIGKFAATAPARFAAENYGLDCLKAIPEGIFTSGVLPSAFHEKRWPRILAAITRW